MGFLELDNSSLSHYKVGLAVFFVIAFVAAATSKDCIALTAVCFAILFVVAP